MTTIERPCDYYPFCHQFEQVDRAIENLVKSGQLYNQHSNSNSHNNHNHNNHNNYGRYQQSNPQAKYRKSPQTQYYYDKGMGHQQQQQPQHQHQHQQQYIPQQQQHRKNYYYSPQLGSQGPPNNVPHVSLTNSAAPISVTQPQQSIQIPAHAHAAPQTYRSQSYSSFQGHSRLGSVGSVGSMTSPALVATSSMTPVLQPTVGPFTKVQRPRGDRDVVSDFDEVDSAIKGLGDMSLELDEADDKEDFGSKSFDKSAFEKPSFESSATSSPISFTFDPFAGLGIGSSSSSGKKDHSKNDSHSSNGSNHAGTSSTAATATVANTNANNTLTTDKNDKEKSSPPSVFAPIGTKPDTLASSQRPWPKKSSLGMSTTTVWG